MKLRDWQMRELPSLRERTFGQSAYFCEVTVVAYTFPMDREGLGFDCLECAILQTWAVLGMMKTVIVADGRFPKLDAFASRHGNVEVQLEPSLVPGKIETMSADCCARLHARFSTRYCLVVQDDGFPLKDTLGDFLGKYDFVGAPYVRISWWRNAICAMLGYWMSNGGFSLRSKRICEAAAAYWPKYRNVHPSDLTVDDLYYTKTLPLRHPSFRLKYCIAPNSAAIRFSYDALVGQPVKALPLGIHRASTFEELQAKGLLDVSALNLRNGEKAGSEVAK